MVVIFERSFLVLLEVFHARGAPPPLDVSMFFSFSACWPSVSKKKEKRKKKELKTIYILMPCGQGLFSQCMMYDFFCKRGDQVSLILWSEMSIN